MEVKEIEPDIEKSANEILKRLLELETELAITRKEYEKYKGGKFENDVDKKKPCIKKTEVLNLFFVDKMVRTKGSKITATDLQNKINEFMSPKLHYSKKEISNFFKDKNIEKKKVGGFIYYMDIDFIDNSAGEHYVNIKMNKV
jgi:hypothetical protein